MNEDKLKRIVSFLCAALFVVATALGIPVSESLLKQQQKSSSLDISDECEAEIEDIPVYGDISEPCRKEVKNLHRKLEHIEGLCSKEEK